MRPNHEISLDELVASLTAYYQETGNTLGGADLSAGIHAICQIFSHTPVDLGGVIPPDGNWEEAEAHFAKLDVCDLPEGVVARLWLQCLDGEANEAIIQELARLAIQPLWAPAQSRVFRALTWLGQRQLLGTLLPQIGELSFAQAEACLEAQYLSGDPGFDLTSVEILKNDLTGDELQALWIELIRTEWSLAHTAYSIELEKQLITILDTLQKHTGSGWIANENQRMTARAAAALTRLRIGQACNDGGILASPAGEALPTWEHHFLQGLIHWQGENAQRALECLLEAIRINPRQCAPRLACASLIAATEPSRALDILKEHAETRQAIVTRAALMARLERYDDAESALLEADKAPDEAFRQSWKRAIDQTRQQAARLTTALAERRGNTPKAHAAWQQAMQGANRRALDKTRQFFTVWREIQNSPENESWQRNMLRLKLDRGRQELSKAIVSSDADELFFRAMTLMESNPDEAGRYLEILLRRKAWVEAEQKAGARRIICAGDALLRMGKIDSASRAYEAVGQVNADAIEARKVAIELYRQIVSTSPVEELTRTPDARLASQANNPPMALMAALGHIINNDPRALDLNATAREQGASEAACRSLESLANRMLQQGYKPLDEDSLDVLPAEIRPFARLLCGKSKEYSRIKQFHRDAASNWLSASPVSGQKLARGILAGAILEKDWTAVQDISAELEQSGQDWALQFAYRARLRNALELGLQGNLDAAEREIRCLEQSIDKR